MEMQVSAQLQLFLLSPILRAAADCENGDRLKLFLTFRFASVLVNTYYL